MPIAGLLGIWHLKWQMEDICFRHLHPHEYQELLQKYEVEKKLELAQYISRAGRELGTALDELKINHEINGRFKHLYSIWQKMNNKQRKFDEIYDVFALRVIVPTSDDCYRTLGVIHSLWKPNNNRFKDYICQNLPKVPYIFGEGPATDLNQPRMQTANTGGGLLDYKNNKYVNRTCLD